LPQRDSGIGHPWRVDRFLEFLRTGIIDGLGVGASAADVRETLGPPDDTSAIKPPIWKYEQTEITFRDGLRRDDRRQRARRRGGGDKDAG
jgi:hypothetical protein